VVAVVNKVLLSNERLYRSTQIAILSTPELDASDPLLATDEVVQSLVEGLQSIDDAGITMRECQLKRMLLSEKASLEGRAR
jgi:hypothetical protein